jgi:uncharacterized DUF497 family protein
MVYNQSYSFEFDLTKSRTNKKKHGIDFIEAQEIWKYSHIEFSLRTIGETRWAVIGQIGGIFWTAIITKRKIIFELSQLGDHDMKKNKLSKTLSKKKIKTENLDKRFEDGNSILEYADLDLAVFRVNVDFPAWSVAALDLEANRLGISRQALIKFWVIERLDQAKGFDKTGS